MNYVRVAQLARIMNRLYRRFDAPTRRDEVLFVSRQYDEPSEDFRLLAREFEQAGWTVTTICQTEKGGLVAYARATWRQLRTLGRCKVCITDGYSPVISAIDFPTDACEHENADTRPARVKGRTAGNSTPEDASASTTPEDASATPADSSPASAEPWVRYTSFPTTPLVVQLWHGFGAYKAFGWQAVGTPEGRTLEEAQAVHMHRNYSWVICSGESNRQAFAQAFGYPTSRVVALGRPSIDALRTLRASEEKEAAQRAVSGEPLRVLFAPTLRKATPDGPRPFEELHRGTEALEHELGIETAWSWHPVGNRTHIGTSGIESLLGNDVVVTDYSSIVYEAAALGKKVLLYVPDLAEYRQSPGLFFDPSEIAPGITCRTQDELIEALLRLAGDSAADNPAAGYSSAKDPVVGDPAANNPASSAPASYDARALAAIVDDTFDAPRKSASTARAIFEFIEGKLGHAN